MTALQWIVKEAKAQKNKYPKKYKTWKEYIKQASKQYNTGIKPSFPIKKVGTMKKKTVKKKAAKKVVKKTVRKNTHYKKIKSHQRRVNGIKRKPSETGILKRIHIVKKDVERLDEAQHKHMMGNIKAKPTIIALAKKISNFTDSNDHNKSILLLAKFLKSKKAIQIMNNVIKMSDNFGYMPKNLIDIREQIYNSLMMILKSKYGNVDYKTIQNSF